MAVEQQIDQSKNQQNPQTNQEEQLGAGASGTGNQAPSMSGAAPTSSGNAPTNTRQPQGSGRFSNLQKYIGANKSFDTGSHISDKSNQQLSNIRQGIESQRNQVLGPNGIAQNIQQKVGTQGEQLQNQAFQDPNAVVNNQDQLNEFQKLRIGGYSGDVQNLAANANQYNGDVNNLQQQAQNAGTEAGRFNLLQQRFANPGYSRGQQRLDQLLLQSTPGSAQSLRSALSSNAQNANSAQMGLQTDIGNTQSTLSKIIGDRQTAINNMLKYGSDTGETPESDLNQRGYSDIEADLQNRMKNAPIDAEKMHQQYETALTNNSLTSDQLQKLGLSGINNIYDTNLSNYLSKADQIGPATISGVANQDDVNRYRALSQLAGGSPADIFAGQTQFGNYNPINLDVSRLNNDITSKHNILNTNIDTIQNQLKSVVSKAPEYGSVLNALNSYKENQTPENYTAFQNALNLKNQIGSGRSVLDELNLLAKSPYQRDFAQPQLDALKKIQELNPTRLINTGSLSGTDNTFNTQGQ